MPPVRSKKHYHTPKYLVFQVEQQLYRLPIDELTATSRIFGDCFSLPDHPGIDGSSDENPIVLESILIKDFDPFLDFVLPEMPKRDFSFEELESVLKLSTLYMVQRGREFAIKEIKNLGHSVSPTQLIRLSCLYRVQEWFRENLLLLASEPLDHISQDDLVFLATNTTFLKPILTIRRTIEHYRLCILEVVGHELNSLSPPVQIGCKHPQLCASECRYIWRTTGACMLTDPDTYYTAAQVGNAAQAAEINDMCQSCKSRYFRTVLGKANFGGEDALLDNWVDRICIDQGITYSINL